MGPSIEVVSSWFPLLFFLFCARLHFALVFISALVFVRVLIFPTTMNPDDRTLLQVRAEDDTEANPCVPIKEIQPRSHWRGKIVAFEGSPPGKAGQNA